MEKSRIMEDFQMEFELLYCGNKNMSLNYVLNQLFENLEEVDVARGVIDLERKRNRRRKFLSGVLGKHAVKFGYLDGWYYDADDIYLDRKAELLSEYYEQLNSFYGAIDEYNCTGVFNLMNFARFKNIFYRREIQEKREKLQDYEVGYEIDCNKSRENSSNFAEWFVGALDKVCGIKAVEKVKK